MLVIPDPHADTSTLPMFTRVDVWLISAPRRAHMAIGRPPRQLPGTPTASQNRHQLGHTQDVATRSHSVALPADDLALLNTLGLTAEQYAVYRTVISLGDVTVEGVGEALELPPSALDAAVEHLRAVGLVRFSEAAPRRFRAVDPTTTLRPRLVDLTRTADALEALVAELAEDFYDSRRRHDPVRLVEVITGATAIRSTMHELQRQASSEMLWLCKAHAIAMPSEENTEEFGALDRGVRYRTIYEPELLEEPGMMRLTAAGIERGEEARVLRSLPVRLGIADRQTAVVPLTTTLGRGQEPTAAIVNDSALSQALVALFEQLWDRAKPLERRSSSDLLDVVSGPVALGPDDRYLMSLVVSGIPDKAIASQMGVSIRTVQRRVSTFMEAMNVETRIELAYVVGRHRALT